MDHITNDNIILFEMEMYIKQINDLKEENKELKRIVKQQEAIWFSQENLIQSLLELKSPIYLHHPLILDSNGIRLSKRTRAQTIKSLKASGLKREDVIDLFGKENMLSLLNFIK